MKMRFLASLAFTLAGTALASNAPKKDPHSGNDAYMKKLDEVTSQVLLHQTTGPEAGLDVCSLL